MFPGIFKALFTKTMSVFLVLLDGGYFLGGGCLTKSESCFSTVKRGVHPRAAAVDRCSGCSTVLAWSQYRFGCSRAGKSGCWARLISLPQLWCFLAVQGSCPEVLEGSRFSFFIYYVFLCFILLWRLSP